ncbi:MAG: phosphoribosylformimino-5-aminoimidazole carboxamide ribotide isomerase [Rickettsiales bacterium]|jgi:phosphoribosylformimino-5-aminoimidazole carboxamide ribotide isomerase
MIIYPAIDLKDGKCVRLLKGDMNQATIFNDSPSSQGKIFQDQGFKFLHIVDLDGAIAGNSANEKSVKEILKNINIPAQLGGGIRNLETIQKWLDLGLNRVILGTVALQNPELVKQAAKKFPGQIVVGIDAKNGMVATHGWVSESTTSVVDLAKKFEDAGVSAIVYTDINRDGTGEGVDFEGTANLAKQVSIPIIASGGVGKTADIENISKLDINGVIVGRALYDGKIDLNSIQKFIN